MIQSNIKDKSFATLTKSNLHVTNYKVNYDKYPWSIRALNKLLFRKPLRFRPEFPKDLRKLQTKRHQEKAQELTGLIKSHQNKSEQTCYVLKWVFFFFGVSA